MDLTQRITTLTESILGEGQFLVDLHLSLKKSPGKILVLVDGDQGINIDACAEISRELSKQLDDMGLMDGNYNLEVSTPGVDQPLKLKRQYTKHIGRKLKVKTADKQVEGRLKEIAGDQIVIEQEVGKGKTKEIVTELIPFSAIDKAFVLVSFK